RVFTSNKMDEERAKRITEQRDFIQARVEWKKATISLYKEWRRTFLQKDIEEQHTKEVAAEQAKVAFAEQKAAAEHVRRQAALEELLRKTEIECQLAMVRVGRAQKAEETGRLIKKAENLRYAMLLEESRNWIDSEEELEKRINQSLENPEAFGFIVDLPIAKGL
uniref:mS26 n=1 Tax=Polytomella magna TaxID=353565 RepID=UPI002240E424|nr:Chain Bv, mS26 [Polytomella magna]8APN_Bv Chain Bv, mS26 [Polytomella magna]8APO_Bv Chain Bv, mS26 [Polytomella magna]